MDPREQAKSQAGRDHGGGPSGMGILAIAAIVVGIALVATFALYLVQLDKGPVAGFTPADDRDLFPKLAARSDEVGRVSVEGQDRKLHFQKEGEAWHLLDRSGYPVRDNMIESLLGELGDLKANYVSTQDPPPYVEYGVADSAQAASRAVHVTARSADGEALARATLGHTFSVPGDLTQTKVFVRREGDPRVWLADSDLRLDTQPLDWVWQDIVNVPRTQVEEVITVGTTGEEIVIRRDEDATFYLARGLPNDREMTASPSIVAIASAFENLKFNDVRSAKEAITDGRPAGRASISTEGDLTYEVQFIEDADELWAVFAADVTNGPVKKESADGTRSGEERESDKTHDAARHQAKAFNARHGDWAYLLPNHIVAELRTRPEDLTQGQSQAPNRP